MKQQGTATYGREGWGLLYQGSPVCVTKKTKAEIEAVARQLQMTIAPEAWNTDRGEWVHLDTIEEGQA